jgi:hypothetical protein
LLTLRGCVGVDDWRGSGGVEANEEGVLLMMIGWPGVVGGGKAGEPRTTGFCEVPFVYNGTKLPSGVSTNVTVRGAVDAADKAAGAVEFKILS